MVNIVDPEDSRWRYNESQNERIQRIESEDRSQPEHPADSAKRAAGAALSNWTLLSRCRRTTAGILYFRRPRSFSVP